MIDDVVGLFEIFPFHVRLMSPVDTDDDTAARAAAATQAIIAGGAAPPVSGLPVTGSGAVASAGGAFTLADEDDEDTGLVTTRTQQVCNNANSV